MVAAGRCCGILPVRESVEATGDGSSDWLGAIALTGHVSVGCLLLIEQVFDVGDVLFFCWVFERRKRKKAEGRR